MLTIYLPFRRQQLRLGQRPGAPLLPDRLLLGRLLRALRLPAGADHAEGVRVQVPLRRGDERGQEEGDRGRAAGEDRVQGRGQVLQEVR